MYDAASPTASSERAICSKVSPSMKLKPMSSLKRYWKSRRSMVAFGTFSPARNVRSMTAPVIWFLSFIRTKALPLPGFTCW